MGSEWLWTLWANLTIYRCVPGTQGGYCQQPCPHGAEIWRERPLKDPVVSLGRRPVFLCLICLFPKSWYGQHPYPEKNNRQRGHWGLLTQKTGNQLNSQDKESKRAGKGLWKTSLPPGLNSCNRQPPDLISPVPGWVGATTAVPGHLQMLAQ